MYLPQHSTEARLDVLHSLIREYPLGTWVTAADEELNVNHIPFLLDTTRGEFGTIVGHVARANPVWTDQALVTVPDVVIFRGPQVYVSPSWYPSKQEHGKAVPTWNYAIVTIHGRPKFVEDRGWLFDHLRQLTDVHEASQSTPWKIDDAPKDFTDLLIDAIVGVEIPILKIEGKWKTSQNRPNADKIGVAAALSDRANDEARAMASLIRQHVSV